VKSGSRPLEGVKVMDLSIYVAGPATSTMLGYMGAEVIKVETLKGDPYRGSGSGYGMPAEAKRNPLYDACNGYKRCISVDFRSEEGKEVLRRIAAEADIIVTNYRPKPLKAMGMDYETVSAYNPKVVYGFFSGYGEEGPEADRPGFDSTAFFSRSGFAMRGTYQDCMPMATISAAGDTISSMGFAVGILGAFVKARETGKGEKVSSSLYGSGLWVMGVGVAQAQFGYVGPFPKEKPGFLALNADYRCKDGVWVRICGMTAERYWEPLCKALKMEDYLTDERFCTSSAGHIHLAECYKLVQSYFDNFTYEEIAARLTENDYPFEQNYTTDRLVGDKQALANNYMTTIHYDTGEDVYMTMPPFKLESAWDDLENRKGPYLGQHTDEVLAEYNFTSEEIQKMKDEGKIIQFS